jgi:hypothetical protein
MTAGCAVINKADSPELFDTIAPGDRVETWDGIWGTVEAVEPETAPDWQGRPILIGITLTIRSDHLPTFDANGWPATRAGTIRRTVSRYSRDLRYAYTPRGLAS